MSVRLLVGKGAIWKDLRDSLEREARADIAVAYLGKGGADRLKGLPSGSWLVVNASLAAVKTGATSPSELLKLHSRGVKIYSAETLHAKVYVFPQRVYIGSANISSNAADKLDEAAVCVTDAALIRKARKFVHDLPKVWLGPKELALLEKEYRPPRVVGARGRRAGAIRGPKVWFETFAREDPPLGSEKELATRTKTAKAKLQDARFFDTDSLWYRGNQRYREGDTVVIVDQVGGNRKLVCPPGRVISAFQWSNGNTSRWFAILEVPIGNRVDLKKLAGRHGTVWKAAPRYGALRADLARQLIGWWNERLF